MLLYSYFFFYEMTFNYKAMGPREIYQCLIIGYFSFYTFTVANPIVFFCLSVANPIVSKSGIEILCTSAVALILINKRFKIYTMITG